MPAAAHPHALHSAGIGMPACGFQTGSETLVLALGNPLRGDDGVGPAVVEALRQSSPLPKNVILLDDGGRGLMTALLTSEYRQIIIVDAAEVGGRPGEWVRFTPSEVTFPRSDAESHGTLHSAGLDDVLAIGKALDITLPDIVIYGIQPLDTGWSPGLSEPAQRAVPEVCKAIAEKERRDYHGEDSHH